MLMVNLNLINKQYITKQCCIMAETHSCTLFCSCKNVDQSAAGCSPVTGGVPVTEIQVDIDQDRELERIHSIFLSHMDKLDALQGRRNKS